MTKLKYIAAGLLLFMVSFVGGCVGADAKTAEADELLSRFVIVEQASSIENGCYEIIKDTDTGVLYFRFESGYQGGITVLVDADGKPLVDKE